MSLWKYFWQYFETNHFTLYLLIFVLALTFLKYLRLPKFTTRTWLLIILALTLVLRLAWLGYSTYTPKTEYSNQMLESDITNILARDLTQGKWFLNSEGVPAARRPIGYPLFLGALYAVFGYSPAVAYVSSLLLHLWTALLIYLIGKRLFNERAGLWAAFLFAVFPVSIYSIKLITDEHLFVPLWLWGMYLLVKEISGEKVRWPVLWYGVIFGYATMTRTYTIFMPFIIAAVYILLKKNWRVVAAGFFGTLLLMQLVNLPWVIRNYKIWGEPLLYTASARALYSSVNSLSTPEGAGRIPEKGEEGYSEELEKAMQGGNQAVINRVAGRQMTKWLLTHPLYFLDFGTKRYLVFMGWNRLGVWPTWYQFSEGSYDPVRPYPQKIKDILEESYYIFYYILFFVNIFSLILIGRKWAQLSESQKIGFFAVFGCFALWSGLHWVIYPYRKYRYPLEVLMMVFSAYYIDYVAREFDWKKLKLLSLLRMRTSR